MGLDSARHVVVVGLGNPGKAYQLTKHNMGFLVAEAMADSFKAEFREEKKFFAKVAKGLQGPNVVHFLMPTTYMNESGRAVRAFLDFYKLDLSELSIIVVTDDIAIPFGLIRVRSDGSAGGHNGLKSIEAYLGTNQYVRVRMGIGKPPVQMPLADYVLGSFSSEELIGLPAFVGRGVNVVKCLLTEDVTRVMNAVNTRIESKIADLEQRSGEEL